jgi:hypothetical protein
MSVNQSCPESIGTTVHQDIRLATFGGAIPHFVPLLAMIMITMVMVAIQIHKNFALRKLALDET